MSKTSSGLFCGTLGEQADLEEDFYTRYLNDGGSVLDVRVLPGSSGMRVPRRLTPEQMMFLTDKYEVEFAQVYELGPGRNGGGGQYYIYSGTRGSVTIPIRSTTILISHTHPRGSAFPSRKDMQLMSILASVGSPQRVSTIAPRGKKIVRFSSRG